MSKPKLLDAYTKKSETITAMNSDYAIAAEWSDSNPDAEDRIGYFVSNDLSTEGVNIVKATSSSIILGVTVETPGFASNRDVEDCGYDELVPKYSYVSFAGFAPVIDNGTCTVNGTCVVSDDGTAIPSTNGTGYRVIDRVDDTHILIHINPLLQMRVEGKRLVITY